MAGTDYKTKDYMGTTGAVPSGMPKPTVSMYDATAASSDRWLVGAVENSPNTCSERLLLLLLDLVVYIMDRQGRIVWYYADGTTPTSRRSRRSRRDGEYSFFEKRAFSTTGTPSVVKMTLDRETYSASVMVPQLSDGVDMTSDGSLLYDTEERTRPNSELRQMTRDGTVTTDLEVHTQLGVRQLLLERRQLGPGDGHGPAVIPGVEQRRADRSQDRDAGRDVRDGDGRYAFSPSPWNFVWQHYANISPSGHAAGVVAPAAVHEGQRRRAQPARVRGVHDRSNEQAADAGLDLRRRRRRRSGVGGVARRGGAAQERQHAGQLRHGRRHPRGDAREEDRVLREVRHHVASNDYFNKLVGHNFLIDDLYALNGEGRNERRG
jgi:hypothetical protein